MHDASANFGHWRSSDPHVSFLSGASSAIPVFHISLYRVCFHVGSASGCKHDQLPLFDLYTMHQIYLLRRHEVSPHHHKLTVNGAHPAVA